MDSERKENHGHGAGAITRYQKYDTATDESLVIGEQIGAGKDGTAVYRATMLNLSGIRTVVAAKLTPYDPRSVTKEFRIAHSLDNEIEAMKMLEGIPGVTELKMSIRRANINGNEYAVLVQSLAEHGDILKYVMGSTFTEDLARTFFHQLITILDLSHRRGVVHRDIKLENLLLDENYMLRIGDWEFAGFIHSRNRGIFTDVFGTGFYMAPEMNGSGYDGTGCDVWSAGCCLFSMLVGNAPHHNRDRHDTYFRLIAKKRFEKFWQFHSLNSPHCALLSNECKDLLNSIFDTNPSTRITMTQILEHSWMQMPRLSYEEMQEAMISRES